MAVQPQTPYIEHIANGTTTGFNLDFDCDDQDHLIVLVDDVEPVVGSWSLTGGAVVFGAAPTSGRKITVQRNTPFRRDGDFQSYDNSFRPEPMNKGFDKVWLKLQELGVADWLLKIYVDRLHQQQEQKIDGLKNYVDLKDDELRAYLMEEIRKQGVALDQLDEYYDYLMQRLAQIAVDNGWNASFVVDASGLSQQFLNDLQQVVDTRRYRVVANTSTDMTPFIMAAINKNPTARSFYLPAGTIYANIVIPRNYIQFFGDGMGVTRIIGFDGTKSTIDFNKKLYISLKDISFFQKYEATASVVNARDSRYIITDNAEIFQLPNNLGEYSYSVRGLDLRKDALSWTGYNYFKKSRFNRCSYGVEVDTTGDVASVMKFDDCILSFNGYFGAKLVGVEVGGMDNCDTATNGQIGMRDGLFDEGQFGGVYVNGKNFHITGAWHEENHSKFSNLDVPNDIYIHPDSESCTETNPRSQRNNQGGYVFTKSQAQQDQNAYSDTVIDSGMGQAKYQNLIKNGRFTHGINGWLQTNLVPSDYSVETADLPLGYETGLKILSSGGNKGIYQSIYESGKTGNVIDDLTKWIGKTITFTSWVKNLTATSNAIRIGFDTGASGTNVYFSTGNYIATTQADWVKVVITHKITGTEGRIFAGLRTLANCIVTGFRVQLGSRVAAQEPKNITEDGGDIFGTLAAAVIKVQGKNIGFSTTKPVGAGTKGDISYNINVATGSEIGWQYNGALWVSMGRSVENEFASAANFTNANSGLNTGQKWQGRTLLNTGNNKLYVALGANPIDVWRAVDNSGDITPA